MGSVSQGLQSCSGSSDSVRDRRDVGCFAAIFTFWWTYGGSTLFYKIATKILHKTYVIGAGLLHMEQARTATRRFHTPLNGCVLAYGHHSAFIDRVWSWKGSCGAALTSRTQKRDVQVLDSSPGFSDLNKKEDGEKDERSKFIKMTNTSDAYITPNHGYMRSIADILKLYAIGLKQINSFKI